MADAKNTKDNGGFKGIPKADMDVLTKAARAYETLTGEAVKSLGSIPVLAEEEADPEALAKLAEAQLEAQAKVTKATEEAQQAQRKLQQAQDAGLGDVKDVAHPEPILAPIAAQQQERLTAASAAFPTKPGAAPKKGEPMNVRTSS